MVSPELMRLGLFKRLSLVLALGVAELSVEFHFGPRPPGFRGDSGPPRPRGVGAGLGRVVTMAQPGRPRLWAWEGARVGSGPAGASVLKNRSKDTRVALGFSSPPAGPCRKGGRRGRVSRGPRAPQSNRLSSPRDAGQRSRPEAPTLASRPLMREETVSHLDVGTGETLVVYALHVQGLPQGPVRGPEVTPLRETVGVDRRVDHSAPCGPPGRKTLYPYKRRWTGDERRIGSGRSPPPCA